MIHNRSVKEVRRYDIFKLVVLLILLVLLIFQVLRDENNSTAADGDDTTTAEGSDPAYPGSEEQVPYPGSDEANPGGADSAYPGNDGSAYPGSEGSAYPAPEQDQSQGTPADSPAYPGAEEGAQNGQDTDSPGQEQPQAADGDLIVSSPQPGEVMLAGPATLSGTGSPGSLVSVSVSDAELGQTTIDEDGNWQLDVDIPLGETLLKTEMSDALGNVLHTSYTEILVVADTRPESQTEVAIDQDGIFAGASNLQGSGNPGSTIVILVNGQESGSTQVNEDGTWTAPMELTPGEQEVVIQTVDTDGNIINETEAMTITVQEPVSPAVDLPKGNVYAYSLTITGTGQPRSTVQVLADDLPITDAEVAEDGSWSAEINLAAGTYNIDVASLDSSGNIIEQIPGLTLPVLPLDGPKLKLSETNSPEFDPLLGSLAWKGVSNPGTTVVVIANEVVLGSTTTADNGHWSLDTELDSGTYDVTLGETDESGNVISESDPVPVDLAQQPPTVDLPAEIVSEDESGESTIVTSAGSIIWSGQADPNSQVAIVINKEVSVSTTADESGSWTVEGQLQAGDQDFQLAVIDESGQVVSLSEPIPVTVAGSTEPEMDPIAVDPQNGDATVSGKTTPNTTVNLMINGALLASTTSDEDGNYTFEIRLGAGSYEIQVQTVDAAGAEISSTEAETVVVKSSKAGSVPVSSDDQDAVEQEVVIDAVEVAGDFSTLIDGLESAGLTGRLSDVDQPHTLFAPNNEAFDQLPQEVLDAWNEYPDSYAEIMNYLILEGGYTQEELLESQVLTTIGGTNLGFTTDGQSTLVNGVPIVESIPAGVSIVQAVDQVILPPLGFDIQPPIINASGVPVFTGTFLTVVGTAEPGKQILLQVSGENFGSIAIVDASGRWQVADNIAPGVHTILAYMLEDNGTLMAISQQLSLPVQ